MTLRESPYRYYVRVDENGIMQGGAQLSPRRIPGWRVLSRDEEQRCLARPKRWRYPADAEAEPLAEIRLLVGTTRFIAGAERGSVQVQGLPLGANGAWVRINGVRLVMLEAVVYELESAIAARWTIQLDDPRYWAEPDAFVVWCIAEGEGA